MWIIEKDLFEKLPEEAKTMISSDGTSVEDEGKMEEIEKIAGANEAVEDLTESEPIRFGKEDEYEAKIGKDGDLEDMPESKKNEIKSFDDANEMGDELFKAMGKKEKKDKVKPIPKSVSENPEGTF